MVDEDKIADWLFEDEASVEWQEIEIRSKCGKIHSDNSRNIGFYGLMTI